jgi:hypothetical protein
MAAPGVSTFGRAGISLGALLASVALFSVLFTLVFGRAVFSRLDQIRFVFLVTSMFALPVWCVYLPFVLRLKDAEGRRFWIILATGTLIGPVALGLWGLLEVVSGADPQRVWRGDPLSGFGLGALMGFALVVGCTTAALYGLALRRIHRRS